MTPAVRAYLQLMSGRARNVAFFVTSGNTDIMKIAPSMETLANRKAISLTGFNANELRDQNTYKQKISAFTHAIQEFLSSGN
jgi:hypothetical protein